ncbi:MAG TPA: RNA polymerase sigma factor [Bacteroidota bacterium]|nr:RNA polymerase sigma factor [Bacteroidota bacterium]
MNEQTDAELLKRFHDGDELAFNILVQRYQEKVYWTARRFVGNHDDADDVVQEVFTKAYTALKEFRGESGVYTWLYRITVNLALNAIRRKRIGDFLRLDELFATEDTQSEQPDEQVEREEHQRLIEEAIATLPEKQRAVFVLRYYDELPYEEIAVILKTSVGGLKANYFHAVKKIEEYVKRANKPR